MMCKCAWRPEKKGGLLGALMGDEGTVIRAARCAAGGGKKGTRMSQMTTH